MGPAAGSWPRLLGLIVRIALHLDHRLSPPAPAAASALKDGEASAAIADSADAAAAEEGVAVAAATKSIVSLAEATLEQVAHELASDACMDLLQALESSAGARVSGEEPPEKKIRGLAAPVDVDVALQVYERMLECCNATHFLSVLRPGVAAGTEGSHMVRHLRHLEECRWRWAAVADALQPHEEGPRLSQAWVFYGRIIQQMAGADFNTPDVIAAVRLLLRRTSEEVPGDDDLKKGVSALFGRLEYEPQFVSLVSSIIGPEDKEAAMREGSVQPDAAVDLAQAGSAAAAAAPAQSEFDPRVAKVMLELLPSFRNLCNTLRPSIRRLSVIDRHRVRESATPQRAGSVREHTESVNGDSAAEEEEDGQESRGRRSFSARSRSPPPQSDSLFEKCFGGDGRESGTVCTVSDGRRTPLEVSDGRSTPLEELRSLDGRGTPISAPASARVVDSIGGTPTDAVAAASCDEASARAADSIGGTPGDEAGLDVD